MVYSSSTGGHDAAQHQQPTHLPSDNNTNVYNMIRTSTSLASLTPSSIMNHNTKLIANNQGGGGKNKNRNTVATAHTSSSANPA